ncbi:MAG: single-stranded DNA-binding protein [Actinobacteria bacterium]|nr:single-stranded DNA-binding protein [Actinomycetota bacterium]
MGARYRWRGEDREDQGMIHEAQVNLAGYVATDPKCKKVAGDTSFARLRVAYTARRRDKETGEWSDGPTSFVNVQCWRTLADNVQMSVHKGDPVLVMGRLQIRRFEDSQGDPRTAVEIEAMSIGHDLTRGVAKFSRTRWPSALAADTGMQAAASEPGDGAELAGGQEAGARPGQGAGTPNADGVIDESAVAELARELSGSLGPDSAGNLAPDSAGNPAADVTADAAVGVPA